MRRKSRSFLSNWVTSHTLGTTLDSIKGLKFIQSKTGYRFTTDAILLENFISAKQRCRALELGAGSGIISILLAKRVKSSKITAVEVQRSLAGYAEKNIKLNKLEDRVEILREDIKNLKKVFSASKFDLVFSNPPFRKTRSGRLSIDKERLIARHEIKITLPELVRTASHLLKENGRFCLIYHPFRLIELIDVLHRSHLEPKRMRFVHSRAGEEAKMVLIETIKGAGTWLKIEPPLYIYEKGKQYTAEVRKIYGE